MEYNFREIEKKWQKQWAEMKTYQVTEDKSREKFYVLNMFPYPSGAGLHVGHPLGYIASDIYARYKRLMGYNVLNPMGYDAYGLPAEQYAIQTGQHPAITTAENISRYRSQLDKIGFSFDWNREVRTCEPKYYKWTQWAFQKMFNSFYCNTCQKAQPIEKLIEHFSQKGTEGLDVAQSEEMLARYSWPGNLRELNNVVKRATLLTRGSYIGTEELSKAMTRPMRQEPTALHDEQTERQRIIDALRATGGNKTKTAQLLAIDRKTLYNKIQKYNIEA